MQGSYIEITTEENGVVTRTVWTVACDDEAKAMGFAHTAQELDAIDCRPGLKATGIRKLGQPGAERLVGMSYGEAFIERVQ